MSRSGSRRVGRGSRVALAEGLGHEVLVRHRHDRHAHARHAPDLGGVHAAGVHHDLALDVARARSTRRARGRPSTSMPVTRVDGEHPHAAPARAVGQRVGELRRVEVAVGRDERAARARRRWTSAGTAPAPRRPRSAPCGRPNVLRPAGLAAQLLHPLLARREPDAAALDPAGVELRLAGEPPVELDRVHHHLRQRHRPAQLARRGRRSGTSSPT